MLIWRFVAIFNFDLVRDSLFFSLFILTPCTDCLSKKIVNAACGSVSAHVVRGSGSVKPSPPRPRESAQCILDVINFEPEPVNEGEVEESEKEDKSAGRAVQVVRHGAKPKME